jgi:hypothetical protein
MIGKTLFMLFLLATLSFAAPWEPVASLAIVTSLIFVALVYMIGFGFGVDMLKVTAKDEFYQLIALVFMIVIFFGANNIINAVSTAPELTGEEANMQTTALKSLNKTIVNISKAYSDVRAIDKQIGKQASQMLSCTFKYAGYSVTGCGGFSMLATPFSLAGSIMGFALGELNAVYRLIDVAKNYALIILLPLGIILRTFRLTRGAGGFLIAIGISMHLLLPMGILFVDILGDAFLENSETPAEYKEAAALSGTSATCTPGSTSDDTVTFVDGNMVMENTNSREAIGVYNALRTDMKSFMFLIMIKATLGPVIAVLMMIGGIRFLSALAGAEVDVSALARVV